MRTIVVVLVLTALIVCCAGSPQTTEVSSQGIRKVPTVQKEAEQEKEVGITVIRVSAVSASIFVLIAFVFVTLVLGVFSILTLKISRLENMVSSMTPDFKCDGSSSRRMAIVFGCFTVIWSLYGLNFIFG